MTVGIKDVARAAGVSVGTVSHVLNHPERVSPTTRARVLRAIDALGFVRNESARSLRSGRSNTVGLVVLDLANPFYADVARGVETVMDERDMVVTLYSSASDAEREAAHLDHIREQGFAGVVMAPVESGTAQFQALLADGTPVVLMDIGAHGQPVCAVGTDDELGGRLAAEHLMHGGHRRIAVVGVEALPTVGRRFRGSRTAVEAAGGRITPVGIAEMTVQAGFATAQRIAAMPRRSRPTAAICGNDLVALGLLRGLSEADLRVPEDIAVVGYDDIEFAAAAAVPLTSVRVPREELGRAAAQLLLEEVDRATEHAHRTVVFRPEIVARASA